MNEQISKDSMRHSSCFAAVERPLMSDVDLLLLPACEQARRIALLRLAAKLEGILASEVPSCR